MAQDSQRDPTARPDPAGGSVACSLPELPPPAPESRRALECSIVQHGVFVPAVISAGPACPGQVGDGVARMEVCSGLGVECPIEERPFATELEFRLYRLTTNVTRRQLSVAQLISLAAPLEEMERELATRRRAQAKGRPRGEKSLPVALPEEKGETREKVAAAVGLRPGTYSRGQKVLKEGSPKLVADFIAGKESVNSAHRKLRAEQRRAERDAIACRLELNPPDYPSGRFPVVVIDPPWPYEDLPYPGMALLAIADIPVPDLLTEDAIVWCWTTNRFIFEAERIAREHWGLERRNILTWAKDKPGLGPWLQGQTEQCLLLTQGNPIHRLEGHSTLLQGSVREHSRKPEEFYALVEATCPGQRLDLFAREERPGWECWGAETNRFKSKTAEEDPS
jgi:N6-adenosine-specific RNA methylase IME4